MNNPELIAHARAHFLASAGWPRHVANETALEYERLCRLQEHDPLVAPDDESLLHQFSRFVGELQAGDGAAPTRPASGANASATRYQQRFGHPPPYPWQAGALSAGPNPGVG